MRTRLTLGGLAALTLAATGCSEAASAAGAAKPSDENPAYVAKAEPAGGQGVRAVRDAAEDGEEVTVVGRIGGGSDPFVDGLAAFTIVDPAVPFCAEGGCSASGGYCGHTEELPANSATVKLVDASGKPVARDARELLGVKGLSMVVVRGKAKRDDAGNLTVLADQIYVKE